MMNRLHVPAAFPSDLKASESQIDAVRRFYTRQDLSDLTGEQAGDLLDYRECARAIVLAVAPSLYGEDARGVAEEIAVEISRDREMAREVVTKMRKRFDQGSDPDGLPRAVRRFDCFDALAPIAEI